ncbi:hypothetical protein CTRI78_v011029 [Colletotrichum trifolii]|uniref:Uncharacterized protein n=1 Tax=Colletotrichum trifolii TaxID=5466 RepID=A0A4R8QPS4_COLTR|nr:hypothetical protein CTRI78_v011029 [Colletotrichum trifolii]
MRFSVALLGLASVLAVQAATIPAAGDVVAKSHVYSPKEDEVSAQKEKRHNYSPKEDEVSAQKEKRHNYSPKEDESS